jgi:hypothetical protein
VRRSKGAGAGLSLAGGLVAAYGEYNASNGDVGRAVAVGATDTAINYFAGVFVGIAADALLGTELGATLGPGGAVAGALVGAAIGAGLAIFADNAANSAINTVADFFHW